MKILPLFILVACVMIARAQEDGEPRSRAIPKRGPLGKGKTTTTTTPAPQEETEYDDEGDYPENEPQEPSTVAPSSTTEGKKLVGSGVRPFKSNTELLEILKKKRAQAAEAKLNGHSTTSSSSAQESVEPAKSSYTKLNGHSTTTSSSAQESVEPAKSSYNTKSKKRFNNSPAVREVAEDEAPAPKPSRGRFGRPATRSVQEPEDDVSDAAPAARPSRTFRRGGN